MSRLTGTFEAGDLVWQQMYSPVHPRWDATLQERIDGGVLYGERRVMRVIAAGPAVQGIHELSGKPLPPATWAWVLAEPGRERDRDHYSYVDDNWCVLEHVDADGMLW
ncbi:hypothetical protein PYV02_14685 [Leifsonia sp. H3M29-4]|jgi:hypothetical protein|uniref:hypothetical protein n=1 Tax=Salinibacterium metalliresistens TaxID=3031321 RepID=UPI0023D9B40D|nr:hypothetical protein [Salinibacterium metalliresistens]MDF1480329.1 hypothetical protein [Salinibacterium metalliresistens]